MASVTLYDNYDDSDLINQLDGSSLMVLDSTTVNLEDLDYKLELIGNTFSLDGSGNATGTITSAKLYLFDLATMSWQVQVAISGLNYSFQGFVDQAQFSDYDAWQYLLKGGDSITGSAGEDLFSGGASNDTLDGGDGRDYLSGGGGNDSILGGAGSDWLDGNGDWFGINAPTNDNDTLVGGAGNDLYTIENSGDLVIEVAGEGYDRVIAQGAKGFSSYQLTDNVEALELFHQDSSFVMTGKGNALNNKVGIASYSNGMGAREKLYGFGGNDRLYSGDGNDTLDGGAGNDTMLGGTGNDVYYVNSNGDKVMDEAVDFGQPSSDKVFYAIGVNGSTASLGGTAGGLTNSITFKYIEHLQLGATTANNIALNGVGNAGKNAITGNLANNKLFGLNGNDSLYGFGGADTLDGGNDADLLAGGGGNDVLTGGTGNDAFLFNFALGTTNVDTITDFNAAADTIKLDKDIFTVLALGEDFSDNFVLGTAALDGNDWILFDNTTGALYYDANGNTNGNSDAIQFANVYDPGTTPASLTAADFVVVA